MRSNARIFLHELRHLAALKRILTSKSCTKQSACILRWCCNLAKAFDQPAFLGDFEHEPTKTYGFRLRT